MIPLYFTDFFSPIGIIIWEWRSFERQKMYLLVFFVICAIFERIIQKRASIYLFFTSFSHKGKRVWESSWKSGDTESSLKEYSICFLLISLLLIIPSIALIWWNNLSYDTFFFWSQEKHHGYIWYASLMLLALLISTFSYTEKRKLVTMIMIGAVLVAFFAVIEYFRWYSAFWKFSWWNEWRAASTLWNPNYVAGFLLMCLPLFSLVPRLFRSWYIIFLISGILSTVSYIGMALMWSYVLYELLCFIVPSMKPKILTVVLSLLSVYIIYMYLPEEKLLSFKGRFVLMDDIWTHMVQYPLSFVIWFWPESVMAYFSEPRSELVNSYFPMWHVIDSSHSIGLDALFKYWIFPLVYIWYLLFKRWNRIQIQARIGFILGFLFFSLNVVVTVHMILFILFGMLFYKEKNKSR